MKKKEVYAWPETRTIQVISSGRVRPAQGRN